jgi:hypothetical protein
MAGPFACLEFGHVVRAPLGARMRQAQIELRFRSAGVALRLKQLGSTEIQAVTEILDFRRWPIEVSARF